MTMFEFNVSYLPYLTEWYVCAACFHLCSFPPLSPAITHIPILPSHTCPHLTHVPVSHTSQFHACPHLTHPHLTRIPISRMSPFHTSPSHPRPHLTHVPISHMSPSHTCPHLTHIPISSSLLLTEQCSHSALHLTHMSPSHQIFMQTVQYDTKTMVIWYCICSAVQFFFLNSTNIAIHVSQWSTTVTIQ